MFIWNRNNCLRAGIGFGSNNWGSSETEKKLYTSSFDMKQEKIPAEYLSVLPEGETYKKMLWILDNSYVAPKTAQEQNTANEYKNKLLEKAGIPQSENKLTDEDIDAVQQLAIWYFTNPNSEYQVGDSFIFYIKNEDGTFQSPFSPLKWGDAFTEGNSWHYSWSVFHDPQGLIDLMGGKDMFITMLDSVFSVPPVFDESYYGQVIHEIREMTIMNMGNYAHGNQPIQHMIYLYNYAGQPWKAQYWLRQVMDRMYTPGPDGYCGDEDNGQTSAWYVFSALGFYPVCPGTDEYVVGAPLFKKATLHLENGNSLIIRATDNNKKNMYIQTMNLNGTEYKKNYLRHEDLLKGGNINFQMGSQPNLNRGTEEESFPYSFSKVLKKIR